MKITAKLYIIIALISIITPSAYCCTSMLVSAKMTANHRPLLWKHRDTGTEHNFVERVDSKDGKYGYVALFNGGDSLLTEAWAGMNDVGFAIMNTVSYNIAPDTAKYKDQEGIVMSKALAECRTVDDFAALLDRLPRPMGVSTNFGVMDAQGHLAYFETNDNAYIRCNVDENVGYLIRTNYSVETGNDTDGMGYIRYEDVCDILKPEIQSGRITPQTFTEKASRSFWHSLLKKDCSQTDERWVVDQDFIPRYSSSASIVVEGVNPGESTENMTMWTLIGYPPCSVVRAVKLDKVPDELRPLSAGHRSSYCNEVIGRKRKAFPIHRGSGSHYIDMQYLREVNDECRRQSEKIYETQDKSR